MYGKSNRELFDEWPKYEVKHGEDVLVTIAVQVNGKMRGTIETTLDVASSQDQVVALALSQEGIAKHVTTDPKKIIFVPGKILNLVV
jgi:leucyl-tRNA synthetase